MSWWVWGTVLFVQQFSNLFHTRSKSSGSGRYVALTGFAAHSLWYLQNTLMVKIIIDTHDPKATAIACGFYATWCTLGGWLGQQIALKIEKGERRVGAYPS